MPAMLSQSKQHYYTSNFFTAYYKIIRINVKTNWALHYKLHDVFGGNKNSLNKKVNVVYFI